jgi:hypothetical protein
LDFDLALAFGDLDRFLRRGGDLDRDRDRPRGDSTTKQKQNAHNKISG